MPRPRLPRGGGKKIDFKQWGSITGLIAELSANQTTISGSLAFTVPATILRFRGYVAAMFDESMQAGDQLILTFGLGLFSTDAVALGATAMPEPANEPEFPWIWWKEMRLDAFAAAAVSTYGSTNQRYEVDSRAMRKVKPGESFAFVVQATGAQGAPVTLVDIGQTRVLIGT